MQEDFLLVGLGNPGPRYAKTRHNLGYMVLDKIAESVDAPSWREKFQGEFSRAKYKGCMLNMLKPTTFMNLSGQSVVGAANFYRIQKQNIVVIHDELDLPFGTIRIKKGGGSGGHKGIESVKQHVGGDFIRVRLGIGRPRSGSESEGTSNQKTENISDFVLDNFNQHDKKNLIEVIDRSGKAVKCVIRRGVSAAMNEFNKRGGERDES